MHYLKAVQAAGTDDAQSVMAKCEKYPSMTSSAENGRIREDGHVFLYLQVKASNRVTDYYKLRRSFLYDAFRPFGQCLPVSEGDAVAAV
jgi:branched-chain amino acid transport system substrate-binding protein